MTLVDWSTTFVTVSIVSSSFYCTFYHLFAPSWECGFYLCNWVLLSNNGTLSSGSTRRGRSFRLLAWSGSWLLVTACSRLVECLFDWKCDDQWRTSKFRNVWMWEIYRTYSSVVAICKGNQSLAFVSSADTKTEPLNRFLWAIFFSTFPFKFPSKILMSFLRNES